MIDRYHLRATFVLRSTSSIDRCVFQHGNSALHEASWRGYSRTVAALAKALGTQRAPLHARNLAGFAPLHLACQNGHNQSCRELLLAGCNPDLQNNVSNSFDLFPLSPLRRFLPYVPPPFGLSKFVNFNAPSNTLDALSSCFVSRVYGN